ncbi:MAG: hypothetical protein IPN38_02490 [Flavobacteriales bacterium]|nr:hypothetical protein [Flavobacteriales bacterium]
MPKRINPTGATMMSVAVNPGTEPTEGLQAAQVMCEHQCGGELGELAGLDPYGPDLKPVLVAADLGSDKGYQHQQKEHEGIRWYRHILDEVAAHHHERRAHHQADHDPHALVAVLHRRVEEVRMVCAVGGAVDVRPAHEQQQQVDDHHWAVHVGHDVFALVHRRRRGFLIGLR